MNVYPGQGLLVGTAVLGNQLGHTYPAGAVVEYCKIYGTLLTALGSVPGQAGTPQVNNGAWRGVTVKATTTALELFSKVITTEKVEVVTNDYGYFEFTVIKGLTVVLTCTIFGKVVTVDTTGKTSVDISTYF